MGGDGPPARGHMAPDGKHQSHMGTTRPKTLIPTKSTTTIGTWTIRASRWSGCVQKRLISVEFLLCPGHDHGDAAHTKGAALML
ncbi:hypothetical protein DPMN_144230 [Dreissena polymorpha]|uniref:Uncharacterized protein n=1 Tax=Dreissena polymorpha TaxID=45954 RepID=A0A9D4GHS9_DREPO|nr:hypothetical protein DPMN_144230 [Dreissena polymorpha]